MLSCQVNAISNASEEREKDQFATRYEQSGTGCLQKVYLHHRAKVWSWLLLQLVPLRGTLLGFYYMPATWRCKQLFSTPYFSYNLQLILVLLAQNLFFQVTLIRYVAFAQRSRTVFTMRDNNSFWSSVKKSKRWLFLPFALCQFLESFSLHCYWSNWLFCSSKR